MAVESEPGTSPRCTSVSPEMVICAETGSAKTESNPMRTAINQAETAFGPHVSRPPENGNLLGVICGFLFGQ